MYTEELIRQKIAENNGKGVWIEGISNEAYHLIPGFSSSDIKFIINSTIKKWLHRKAKGFRDTPDTILGTMIHTYVLENAHFWERYFREEEAPRAPARNTTIGKDLFKKWSGDNLEILHSQYNGALEPFEWQIEYIKAYHPEFNGKLSVDVGQMKVIEGIAESIKKHVEISKMMNPAHCKSEISMFWIDPETDLLCKCRPDINNFSWPCVLDVKSCQDASLEEFEKDITNRDMHVSAWWYLWGSSMVFDTQYDEFIYIPCEKEEPYEVTYYPADVGSLGVAEGLCRAGLVIFKRYLDGMKTNPETVETGYSRKIKAAGIKPYAFNKLKGVIHRNDLESYGLEKYLGVM